MVVTEELRIALYSLDAHGSSLRPMTEDMVLNWSGSACCFTSVLTDLSEPVGFMGSRSSALTRAFGRGGGGCVSSTSVEAVLL